MYEHEQSALDENELILYHLTHHARALLNEQGNCAHIVNVTRVADDWAYVECLGESELNPEIEKSFNLFPMGKEDGVYAYVLTNRDNMERLWENQEKQSQETTTTINKGHFDTKEILNGIMLEHSFDHDGNTQQCLIKEGEKLLAVNIGNNEATIKPTKGGKLRRSVFVGKNRVSYLIVK